MKTEIRNPKSEAGNASNDGARLCPLDQPQPGLEWLRLVQRTQPRSGLVATLGLLLIASSAAPAEEVSSLPPVAAGIEAAPEAGLTVTTEADFNSRYVWRGLAFSPGAVVQPFVALAYSDFTFTTWFNCDLDGGGATPRWNETDLSLSYSHEFTNGWTLGAAVQSYLYPTSLGQPNTAELMLQGGYAVELSEVSTIELSLRQSVDLAAYPGAYYGELAPGWTRDLGHGCELSAGAFLAWATDRFTEAYAGVEAGGFYLVSAEVALKWSLTKQLSVRPHVAFSHLLRDALRQDVEEPNFIWGGVALTLELP